MATGKDCRKMNVITSPEVLPRVDYHLLAVYEGLDGTDTIIRDPKKTYQDKVNILLSSWEQVTAFLESSTLHAANDLINRIHRQTLKIILQGEWNKLSPATKTHLNVTLQRCAGVLSGHETAPKCQMLMKLVKDPWGHPILVRIFKKQDISDQEVLEFCHAEMGVLLTMRLQRLCDDKCEDLAYNLVVVIVRCLNLLGSRLQEESTKEDLNHYTDLYVILSYHYGKTKDISKYLKTMSCEDGLKMIRRMKSARATLRYPPPVWFSNEDLEEFLASAFLSLAMTIPLTGSLLAELTTEWASLLKRFFAYPLTLPELVKKFIKNASTSTHIYTFSEALLREFGDNLAPIYIELYVRGLTTDMNVLEELKMQPDKEKVCEIEVRLSEGFIRLSELLKENLCISRECVLTAFSLSPTLSCFEKIKELAVATGKCQIIPPVCRNIKDESEINRDSKNNNKKGSSDQCDKLTLNNYEIPEDTGQIVNMRNSATENRVRALLSQINNDLTTGELDSTSNKPHSHDETETELCITYKSPLGKICERLHSNLVSGTKEPTSIRRSRSVSVRSYRLRSKSTSRSRRSTTKLTRISRRSSTKSTHSFRRSRTKSTRSFKRSRTELTNSSLKIDTVDGYTKSRSKSETRYFRSRSQSEVRNLISNSPTKCQLATSQSKPHKYRSKFSSRSVKEKLQTMSLKLKTNLTIMTLRSKSIPPNTTAMTLISRSKSSVRSLRSRSKSATRRKRSRSKSVAKSPKSKSVTKSRRSNSAIESRSRSKSVIKSSRSRSNSATPSLRSRSYSTNRSQRSRSNSGSMSLRSRSNSPYMSMRSRSNSPYMPLRSRSNSVVRSIKSRSNSAARSLISKSTVRSLSPTGQEMACTKSESCYKPTSLQTPSCRTGNTSFNNCDTCSFGHLGDLCPQCGEFSKNGVTNSNVQVMIGGVERKERTLDAFISTNDSTVTESLNYDVFSAPNQLLDENSLGLSSQLCDDLAVVISSPRYHLLSWVLDWSELNLECEKYLKNFKEVRNTNKELKFLNIDYNQFKDWPVEEDDDISGIEKGYEHCQTSYQENGFSSSYKKHREDSESETDSSVNQRACHTSESEYDSGQDQTGPNTRSRMRLISDTDSQDSKTDSLISEGVHVSKLSMKVNIRKKEEDLNDKRFTQENFKEISQIQVLMKDDRDDVASDLSDNDISIFRQMDENGKEVSNNKVCDSFDSSLRDEIKPILALDKRSSDPSVLRTLRMFRPCHVKKSAHVVHSKDSQSVIQEDKAVYTKFAPMLSTLNLNPRIVLTRTDVSCQDLKNRKQQIANSSVDAISHITSDITYRNINCKKNANCIECSENELTSSYSLMGDSTKKSKLDDISQAVVDSEVLAKSVPGLNSLEMIIPPQIESTVQVVQLPRNSPTTSSNNSSPSDTSNQKGQASNSSTSTCPNAPSCSSYRSAVQPQSLQISVEENTPLLQVLPSQSSLTSAQIQDLQKSGSQMDVKYLTKASEVNEILRSTLGGNIAQVQTISLVASSQVPSSSQGKQKLSSQPEIKYLTSTSEVNEILRSTLIENSQQNQLIMTSQSTDVQMKQKNISQSEVKYLTTTNEVNEILRSTPISAHIQKIGQPSDSPVLELGSSTTPDSATQISPGSSVSFMKAVDINMFGSLISSSSTSNAGSVENQTASNDSHIHQVPNKKDRHKVHFKSVSSPKNNARSSQTDNESNTQIENVSTPLARSNEQHGHSLQSLNEDNIRRYALRSGVVRRCKPPLDGSNLTSSQIASLPKFQHAFGKSIYNQTNNSSDSVNSSQPSSSTSCEVSARTPQAQNTSESVKQSTEIITSTSSSTVLSKAVQTVGINSLTSQSNTTTTKISLPESVGALNLLMSSALQRNTAGSIVAVTQSSVQRHLSGSFKRSNRFAIQSVQASSQVLFDLHQIPSSIESQIIPSGHSSSSHRNQTLKTLQPVDSTTLQRTDNTSNSPVPTPPVSLIAKDSVLRNNMSALLAAALQGSTSHRQPSQNTNSRNSRSPLTPEQEICIVESSSSEEEGTDAATQTVISSVPIVQKISLPVVQKSTNKQSVPSRVVRNVIHIPGGNLISRTSSTMVSGAGTITSPLRQQQQIVHATSASTSTSNTTLSTRLSQTVGTSDTLIAHGSMEPSVSSTTLEQLREFESVLEQVTNTSQMKERSTVQPQSQTETIHTPQLLLSQASTSSDPSPEFHRSPTTPRVSVAYVSQAPTLRTAGQACKITSSPVVVVTSYCQPVASPALSVTSQSSSSPCVTPAPVPSTSTGKSPPKSSKSKSKSVKTSPSSTASKASPVPKPQQKPQEDEQTAQRIYAILDEYAEQLRNSPDLNNKPAPRRRSNPPTNPSQSSKRKKSGQAKVKLLGHQSSSSTIEMSPGTDDPRTMGSEDSSSGIVQLSHIQDSPASAQTGDEPQSSRTTPSLDVTTETVSLRTVSSEMGDVPESRQPPRLILADAGRAVLQPSADVTVSSNGSVVVGSTTLPLYVPGGVRQVFLPVTAGLTASVQGRPMVMSKGSKVIRVHQVTVPGGSIQMTPGASNMQGAALVVRQMCVNKPSVSVGTPVSVLGQPTVKQVKLPIGSISSQTLAGVSAQPPVVLPPGNQHLTGPVAGVVTSTLTHTLTFPESSVDGVRTESSIIGSDENSINCTSSSAVGLIHRGVQSTFHNQNTTSGNTSVSANKISYCSSMQVSTDAIKLENISNGNNLMCEEIPQNIEELPSSNNHRVLSVCKPAVALVATRQLESNDTTGITQPSLAGFQCLSIGYSRQSGVALRNIGDNTCDLKRELIMFPKDSESEILDSHLPISNMCKRTESVTENVRFVSSLGSKSLDTLGANADTSRPENESQLPNSNCHPRMIQADAYHIQNKGTNPVSTGSGSRHEEVLSHDATSATTDQMPREGEFGIVDSTQLGSTMSPSGSVRAVSENGSLNSREMQLQHRLSDSLSHHPNSNSSNSSSRSSNDNELNLLVSSGGIQLQENNTTNRVECTRSRIGESDHTKSGMICRTNPTHLAFGTDICYTSSTKVEYVSSDMKYRLPMKVAAENRETPWRYVPVVKRVKLIHPMVLRKDDVDRSTEHRRSTLQLTDNISEVEDSSQERRTYVSDAKLDSVARKTGINTSSVLNVYRKVDGSTQSNEKLVNDKSEPSEQKLARMEELKLQKSLSEECEDLGVDEPSTSDLFPDALFLDTNSPPSFEQTIQDTPLSQSVESSEPYSCTHFRPLEYSSSSQEGSHRGSPLDKKKTENQICKKGRKRMCQTKDQPYDWNYRTTRRDRQRHNTSINLVVKEQCSPSGSSKLCPLSRDNSVNSSSKDVSVNLVDDLSESTSGTLVQESSHPESRGVSMGKNDLTDSMHSAVSKKLRFEKSLLGKQLNISSKELDLELSLDTSSKQVLPGSASGILKVFNSKVTSPRLNTYSGSSSEDIVTMLDTYASSLDVTIPSPVPTLPTSISQTQDSFNSQDPLPPLTAAQKFTNTYGKRPFSRRQEVDRVLKRARLNRPNQYFNDHVDSQETWESSSSQEKTCADDEDSGSQSRTDEHCSTPDEPNSDVEVVDISNDSFPSTSTTGGFSTVHSGNPNTSILNKPMKSFNLNGVDMKVGNFLPIKKDITGSKKLSNIKRTTRKKLSLTSNETGEVEPCLTADIDWKTIKTNQSNMSHLQYQRLKRVFYMESSKSFVPTKQSPALTSFSENRKLIVRARKVEECGFNISMSGFVKPSATMVTCQDEEVHNVIPSQQVEKDICSVASQCEERQLNPLGVSRRSSLRGHIKKGCSCCGKDELDPSKKKKEVLKVEKNSKKGPIKGGISKKR